MRILKCFSRKNSPKFCCVPSVLFFQYFFIYFCCLFVCANAAVSFNVVIQMLSVSYSLLPEDVKLDISLHKIAIMAVVVVSLLLLLVSFPFKPFSQLHFLLPTITIFAAVAASSGYFPTPAFVIDLGFEKVRCSSNSV